MEKETILGRIKTVRKATFFSIGKTKNSGKGVTEESDITVRLGSQEATIRTSSST